MSRHPGLIQRPIVLRGRRAVLARPAEAIEGLLR
jgi:arsenate reductase-like glutaredoxin family protein